LNDFTLNTHL